MLDHLSDKQREEFRGALLAESNSLYQIGPAVGLAHKALINSLGNPNSSGYRDNGYESALDMLELILVKNEDQDKPTGYFPNLVDLTSAKLPYMPSAEKDLKIMGRLREERIEPTRELIYGTVPNAKNERAGRLILTDKELAVFLSNMTTIEQYFDERSGASYLTKGHFIEKKTIEELVCRKMPVLEAFGNIWNAFLKSLDNPKYSRFGHWTLYRGNPAVDGWGLINYVIFDAHTGSVIADAFKADATEEVLLNDIPAKGIEELLLSDDETLKAEMVDDVNNDIFGKTMCTASMIRRRGNNRLYRLYLDRLMEDPTFSEMVEKQRKERAAKRERKLNKSNNQPALI